MSLSKTETDVILNKANVALARSQRLVASWLPPKTQEEQANTKSEEELQREEDEVFTAVPETLGVGAPLPSKAADGSWNRTELGSNDKLRRQLLGKNYKKIMSEKNAAAGRQLSNMGSSSGASSATNQSQTMAGRAYDDDDEDEDEGRTALVGKKGSRKRKAESIPRTLDPIVADDDRGDQGDDGGDGEDEASVKRGGTLSQQPYRLKGRRKATSFLDEILTERSRKRKKK
ncbi:hypothetical protein BDV32DRAFT_125078 [Aspergillus pseudonomiae]|uniref:Uncharacterized protein n=1 Tax=Aspergillus pseudonomiae TaxID=1506151 RepID=A0A5N6HZA5_9EURO|nr:uncharacterized protein BDV37DRAFT_133635 [Aspergillus pseudonomiae]KAB8258889.1 hypothetical protein BDV32DRAFT_125078 [Aspergillus pseudonomiae]KAE8403579.1 hypothetical protein BDV37DRAFT_133635 [Aspergillus pseudonomiae]